MSLILSWLLFTGVVAALGVGWGVLVERAAGTRLNDALLLPAGLAAGLVAAGTLTVAAATAPAAVPVVAVGACAGLWLAWRSGRRLARWPLLAAAGVLLCYGAPVLLSGHPTFLGFLKLDDTATWFDAIDHAITHARSVGGEPQSTYSLTYTGDIGSAYPLGAFMLPGVARALVGVDIAWVFQPYLACAAAALALCVYALLEPLFASARMCALLAFLAAQPALLYGYSLWGGVKELTAAFLLALGVACAAAIIKRRPRGWRPLLPLAIAAGALIQTLGVGAVGWVAPALALLACAWFSSAHDPQRRLRRALSIMWLTALTAACVLPVLVVFGDIFPGVFGGSHASALAVLFSSGQGNATKLANLLHPLSVFQLAGIWPVGDFRVTAPTLPSALLIGAAVIAAAGALLSGARRREFGVGLYVAIALSGCLVVAVAGATPWVIGKALAISSPALLAAALAGGGLLWARRPTSGIALLVVLGAGVMWSNALAYHDALLAPYPRLVELQHIGGLVAGKGPTFLNGYEVYADRHFLRAGAPVEPAEYRSAALTLRDGALLTKSAWADLDSFPVDTLLRYRSIVLARSPAESRPPSVYSLVYRGRFYELWQRPVRPAAHILAHVPLGQSNELPYCGVATNMPPRALCSAEPVAVPSCASVRELARSAQREHAELVAYQRPQPVIARGDQTLWPGRWLNEAAARTLRPNTPGTAVTHIVVDGGQRYELWLGGSFARGFEVSVDGRALARVKEELAAIASYAPVTELSLAPGVHTIALTYPPADLTPGSGDNEHTELSAIALQPLERPASRLLTVAPAHARELCGRTLDWIEILAPAGAHPQ